MTDEAVKYGRELGRDTGRESKSKVEGEMFCPFHVVFLFEKKYDVQYSKILHDTGITYNRDEDGSSSEIAWRRRKSKMILQRSCLISVVIKQTKYRDHDIFPHRFPRSFASELGTGHPRLVDG